MLEDLIPMLGDRLQGVPPASIRIIGQRLIEVSDRIWRGEVDLSCSCGEVRDSRPVEIIVGPSRIDVSVLGQP
ncbi:hypothetical protein D3C80_749440 [compost metagenome]